MTDTSTPSPVKDHDVLPRAVRECVVEAARSWPKTIDAKGLVAQLHGLARKVYALSASPSPSQEKEEQIRALIATLRQKALADTSLGAIVAYDECADQLERILNTK